MRHDEIDVQNFVNERESDIKILEKSINSSRKKTMLFQRLPFYRRRRTRSNFCKKQRSVRQKRRHYLKTHVWYAKRFKMIKLDNVGIPIKRNQKSSKFIYKSQHRGFIFDESFKKSYVCFLNDTNLRQFNINYNLINKVQLIQTEEGYIEAIVTEKICILLLPMGMNCNFDVLAYFDCLISLIKINDEFIKDFYMDVDGAIENKTIFYVENINNYESGKLFLSSKDVMRIWLHFIKKGCIPICIEEMQRLALENDYMVYPFDDVHSKMFKMLEDAQNTEFINKYERTPKSKKTSINFEHLYIQTRDRVFFYIFELTKGVLNKNAFIYSTDNQLVGRVIRGNFCFTKGKSKGLCYTNDMLELKKTFKAKNYNNNNFYEIKIVKLLL